MNRDDVAHPLVATVTTALRLLDRGAGVVIGASGGPDSAALVWLTHEARPDLDLTIVHVRHGLRDDRHDVAAVHGLAELVNCRLDVSEVEVVRAGEGTEAAARVSRHGALQGAAGRLGAVAVLLGHTRDDQAETLLLRLARGTTLRGAAGMRPWRDEADGVPVGRPMLDLPRETVHELVVELGLPAVHDPSNDDPAFARNVVRAEVLPGLARHAGDPAGALARFAERAAEDDDILRSLAAAIVEDHASPIAGGGWSIDPAAVHDEPPAVARRVIELLLARVRPEVGVVTDEIDDVLTLAVDRRVARRGVVVARRGTSMRFTRA